MELLLRSGQLEWRSGCVNQVRAARLAGNMIVPGPVDPFPICERGRSREEAAASQLFDAPVTAQMTRDGQLRLTGSGVLAELVPLTS